MSDTLEVGRTAWEMAQFELHYLRGVVTAYWLGQMADGRRAVTRRQEYRAAMLRALREPEFRRMMRGPMPVPD